MGLGSSRIARDQLGPEGMKLWTHRVVTVRQLESHGVVFFVGLHVTTTVELQSSLQAKSSLDIIVTCEFGQRFLGSVQTIDISLMMLGMVKSHDLLGDRWL